MRTPEQLARRRERDRARYRRPEERERQLAYAREYYAKNIERLRAEARERMARQRAENPERCRAMARAKTAKYRNDPSKSARVRARAAEKHRLRRYQLDQAAFAALYMAQGGCCAICGKAARLVVDHDHVSGVVRGLLCDHCNHGLGSFHEDPAAMRAAIEYLRDAKGIVGKPESGLEAAA